MNWLSKLLGNRKSDEPPEDEEVIIVPVPALVAVLVALENRKGVPLIESEVLEARDGAACITMRISHAAAVAQKRGYDDLDPENIWAEWQAFRAANP